MKTAPLRKFLKRIEEEVKHREKVRQEIQASMRRAIRLSKQGILLIHEGNLERAKELIKEADNILSALREEAEKNPEILHMGIVESAYQEYAEACIFLKLVEDGSFIDPKDIGVPSIPYVLGLADTIGELRRRALDSIRRGKPKLAEECLRIMETIYLELEGIDEAYFLIHGLRRKCDEARRIIEATRGDITMEIRRNTLERSIKALERALKEVSGGGEAKSS